LEISASESAPQIGAKNEPMLEATFIIAKAMYLGGRGGGGFFHRVPVTTTIRSRVAGGNVLVVVADDVDNLERQQVPVPARALNCRV
jgi:hypothetical protein